jgi:hypothetical protein
MLDAVSGELMHGFGPHQGQRPYSNNRLQFGGIGYPQRVSSFSNMQTEYGSALKLDLRDIVQK